MKKKQQQAVIIIGPPGSGKGTQAELLADRLGIFHLETSRTIDRNLKNIKKDDFVVVDGKKISLIKEKKIRDAGELMSPPLISFWTKKEVQRLQEEGKGLVFSGSPRTVYEGEHVIPFLKDIYGLKNIKVILIKISEKETIHRNSNRRVCELLRHSIIFTEETKNLTKCPIDGSKLLIRKDDNPDVIKFRLKQYKERTLPLIEYFKKQKLDIKEINGEQSVADVFKDILKSLDLS